jgi:hypothetical protein
VSKTVTEEIVIARLSHEYYMCVCLYIYKNWVVCTLGCWYTSSKKYTLYVYVCYDEEMNMHRK